MDDAMQAIGYQVNPHFDTWAELTEILMEIVGGEHNTFEDSIVSKVMNIPLNTFGKVEMLLSAYKDNHPSQPKPHTFEPETMRESVKRNGGYMVIEAERPE